VESHAVSFVLAPRINAAGRMSSPDLALRLLLASDDAMLDDARVLAEQLNRENERRQQEERAIVAEARRIVDNDPDVGARAALVVAGDGWHRGVIGIVASKLVDAYHRPAIVLALEGDVAHGSCRSIPGFDMLEALEACAPLLDRFGGHKMAAGLSLGRTRVKAFREAVASAAEAKLSPDDLRPRLRLDAPIGFRAISDRFFEDLAPASRRSARPTRGRCSPRPARR